MLTIWFIGMYVIFILQQITIFYSVWKKDKLQERINKARIKLINYSNMRKWYWEIKDEGLIDDVDNIIDILDFASRGGKK